MNNIEKSIKESKEFIDLQNDRQKVEQLLREGRWDELDRMIKVIANKYPIETAAHNLTNPIMPKTIQENASNCIVFLNKVMIQKSVESISDKKEQK